MIEKLIEASIRNRFLVLFLAAALTLVAVYAVVNTPMDAIPDLSENQVIVFTDWMGRSPKEIEDQVTYPLSRKLQGLAGIKAVRASSEFNFSMITLIFEDNINFYFARQRVAEKLAEAVNYLPKGVVPYLAPDTTALGQIFYYTVEPSSSNPVDPARLWALNKFYIVPQLNAARGVADVAVLGGLPLEYQIDVRPEALRAWGVTLGELYEAVARGNMAVGGGVIQKNYSEYLVRGVGWIQGVHDIENLVIKETNGVPVYVKNLAIVQLGTQYRRGVFEKNGSEVTGGIVMMRHGENPLAVTERVKDKIQELQPGLPQGVRIVPAYDRTRLIHGAIHTLTEVMWHEMVIAALAILLILMHVRSVFVICVTLPLSVLFSFLLMFVLRKLGILDVQANIMSLAGITISIGILVDQAIVMTENATHHLKDHFGDRKVTGDIREIVIPACRTVGRPIFFSVLIMLLSFIPVFMLQGRGGKYFHPLAFTKTFALIGVALISVTVVPALIPTFIKGRIRSEEENWIVRSFIKIYRPLLTWALPRWNLVMWLFSVLLILWIGFFPLQALLGFEAAEWAWRICFFVVFAVVVFFTVVFTHGWKWQVASFLSLVVIGLWAYHFPKLGVIFMPALDEGTTLDMPVSWPRISVTQSADDLKHRDGLLRGFPEVESVIGKAGRADTPTDPAPLEMFETLVNFRPKALWPARVLKFDDAALQSRAVLTALEENGYVSPPGRGMSEANPAGSVRDEIVNDATQKALERFDETMRELALLRYREFERELGQTLVRFGVAQAIDWMRREQAAPPDDARAAFLDGIDPSIADALAKHPALEDATRLAKETAAFLVEQRVIDDAADALEWRRNFAGQAWSYVWELLGGRKTTLPRALLSALESERERLWRERVRQINFELLDRGCEAYTWYALEELARSASAQGLVSSAAKGSATQHFIHEAVKPRVGRDADAAAFAPFVELRQSLEKPFRERVFFWPRQSGPKGDLVDDEMSRVLQVPGWSNIFTQPIINRIEMLSTGIRTDVGIKVFGPDLATIDRICKEIEQVIKRRQINGARDVVASPLMGRGYLEINIDREKAARYGISVEDVQNEIEVALGGRVVTYTVEKRERFPVRVRYARASRDDEESIQRLLISPRGMSAPAPMRADDAPKITDVFPPVGGRGHQPITSHASQRRLIPLANVADVKIIEGPAMIRSENGRLYNFVTLNVRGRDMVGFVEEAKRVVSDQVALPEGTHIEWSGEFEHQERAAKTMLLIFPIVGLLIFVILYLTYNDFADAVLMLMAVPEALAGGAFFMYLFPKIMHGWDTPPMDFSIAVWVGMIACLGMATETGIIMLVYLRESIEKHGGLENIKSLEELRQAVIDGAVKRLRPKLLTEGVAIVAIFPMVFATGVGGEILAPMALPVLGGLLISDEVVDLFLPVRFYWIRRARWLKMHAGSTRRETPERAPSMLG